MADPTDPNAQQGMVPQGGDASQGAPPSPQGDASSQPDPDPSAQTPATPGMQQAADGADDGGPRAVGTQKQADDARLQDDPEAEVQASPAEQKQLNQLISRFILFISDDRQSNPKQPSPSQSVLAMLNNPKVPLAMAIGMTVAKVVRTMVHAAQVQGVKYEPDVIFHAADEIVPAMYMFGSAHGIFKGMPPFRGMQPDGSYAFTDVEMRVIGEATMQAIRYYGNLLVQAGEITPEVSKENQDFWSKQIQIEVEKGNVSNEVMDQLSKQGVFDKIHDHLGTSPGHLTGSQQTDAASGADDSQQPSGGDAGQAGEPPSPPSADVPSPPSGQPPAPPSGMVPQAGGGQ